MHPSIGFSNPITQTAKNAALYFGGVSSTKSVEPVNTVSAVGTPKTGSSSVQKEKKITKTLSAHSNEHRIYSVFYSTSKFFKNLLTKTQQETFFMRSYYKSLAFLPLRPDEENFDFLETIIDISNVRETIWQSIDYVVCCVFLSFPMMASSNVDFVEIIYQV